MMENKKKPKIKVCLVAECKNTSLTTPTKLFISVPKKPEVREQWNEAVLCQSSKGITTSKFCCEDHFNLQEDMDNCVRFKLFQNVRRMVMKPGVVPRFFDCCKNQKNKRGNVEAEEKKDETIFYKLLLDADVSCVAEIEAQCQQNLAIDDIVNLGPLTSTSNTDEIPAELGSTVTNVHSVTQELQNLIKSEKDQLLSEDVLKNQDNISVEESAECLEEYQKVQAQDIDEIPNQNLTDDFLRYTVSDFAEEPIRFSEEKHIDERSNEPVKQELCQDADDDLFEEEVKCLKETDGAPIIKSELPVGVQSQNDKDVSTIKFSFINDKELEGCVKEQQEDTCVDTTEQENEDTCAGSCKMVYSKIKRIKMDVDPVELSSAEGSSDSDDCVVVSEDDNSSNMVMMNQFVIYDEKMSYESIKTENTDEGITEKDILEEFEIIDENDDNMCVAYDGTQNPKTIIRRTNMIYSCPLNCTYLTANREFIVEHLISHKRKTRGQHKKVYVCPLCSETLYKSSFLDHIIYHKEPRYACQKCSYTANRPKLLKAHMIAKHEITVFFSGSKFSAKFMTDSIANHIEKPPTRKAKHFTCNFAPCPYSAASEEALKIHEWIQHQVGSSSVKKYKCYIDYCRFETYREEALTDHIDQHVDSQWQCRQCLYKTFKWKRFRDHIISHTTSSGAT